MSSFSAITGFLAMVPSLSDVDLAAMIAECQSQLHERALASCDPEALMDEAHKHGFNARGMPYDPYLVGEEGSGILVCMGTRIDKSSTSHDCSFVSVDDEWVWEHEDIIEEEIRRPAGPKPVMRSVTLIPAHEGMKFDVVTCTASMNVHNVKHVKSFEVRDRQLVVVGSRAPKKSGHR